MRWFAYASVFVLAAAPAHAGTVLSGQEVRVAIEGRLERAVGLHPQGGAWQLPLKTKRLRQPLTRVELVDETSRTHEKWVLDVDGDTLSFDAERFVPTHSYRVELYSNTALVERGVIYLYGQRGAKRARIDFGGGDLLEADAEMRTTPKGTL